MCEVAIEAKNVSKKFCRTLRTAILRSGGDVLRDFFAMPVPCDRLRSDEFWAVDDVSLEVKRGDSLAIIGSNGSGKSTFLNMLNGVLRPDRGQIDVSCRVGALAAVGAGFNPVLTGRENLVTNALMMGMTRREIREVADAIIDFSEVGDFIDMPVKHYSSGMYARLGFAVAVHVPVDMLLIDEVLAVGDLAFAIKCLRKIVEFREEGGAVVLVTHALHHVRYACNRALWLEKGRIRRLGPAADVAEEYEREMLAKSEVEGQVLSYDDRVQVLNFNVPDRLGPSEPLVIDVDLEFTASVEQPIFKLHLHSNVNESLVFSHHSHLEGCEWSVLQGRYKLRMSTIPLHLRPGKYPITFNVSERDVNRHLIWHFKKYVIEVTGDRQVLGIMDAAVKYELTKQ